ncbi:MAG: tetratricopeptide repeat protein, partial [Cyanobacteriota bacterium]
MSNGFYNASNRFEGRVQIKCFGICRLPAYRCLLSILSEGSWVNFKSAQLHFNTGKQLKESGKFDEAIGHYQKALEIEPDQV